MSHKFPNRTSRVQLTLGLTKEYFTEEIQSELLHTISEIAGCHSDEIVVRSVWFGCVKITLEMDAEALKKFLHAVEPEPDDLQPLATDQKVALNRLWTEFALQFIETAGGRREYVTPNVRSEEPNLILFVHGWLGGSTTFGSLPNYLEASTGCRCRLFTYPTGFFEKSHSIAFLARAFDNWVRNELHGTNANVAIVAHSMGGIVVRDFLGSQRLSSRPLCSRIRQISFMASPQAGVWLAKFAKRIPNSATAQAADLSPNSPYMTQVMSLWNSWFPMQGHLSENVRSFYAANDQIVDYASAIGSDSEAIPVLDADHFSIVKPKSTNDEVVRTLARLMTDSGVAEP